MKMPQKQYIVVAGIVMIIITVVGVYLYTRTSTVANSPSEKETVFEDEPNAIPTVSVPVHVTIKGNTEALLTLEGFPKGTTAIEYELTYDTASGSVEGVFGSIKVAASQSQASEKLTFGTCSSGVCKYHDITGKVKGVFKFNGPFGTQLLEQEFSI